MGIAIQPRSRAARLRGSSSRWLLATVLTAAVLATATQPDAGGTRLVATTSALPVLRLQVDARGYVLDGQPLSRNDLERALRVARAQSAQSQLWIDGSESADPQQLMGALALADHAGIRNVGSRVQ